MPENGAVDSDDVRVEAGGTPPEPPAAKRVLPASERHDVSPREATGLEMSLLHAVTEPNLDAMRALLARPDVNPNAWTRDYYAALRMLGVYDREYTTPLLMACGKLGCPEAVELLLQAGADPCQANPDNKLTPLYQAVSAPQPEAVRLLVAAGAPLDAVDAAGGTALHGAIWSGKEEVLKLLLHELKADPSTRSKGGQPVLHEAIWRDCYGAVRMLLDAGADKNARDTDGRPTLNICVSKNDAVALKLLLEAGADPNVKSTEGFTALHEAISWMRGCEVLQQLIKAGARPNEAALDGRTPVHMAATSSYDSSGLKLLIASGGDVSARDKEDRTPLHIAAREGGVEVVQALLDAGADPLARAKGGCFGGPTPRTLARRNPYKEVGALLGKAEKEARAAAKR